VPVAHACDPSYSGGRDEEDRGSKPAWANSLGDPILKNPITKKDWWSGSRCRLSVQAPIPHTKKKKRKKKDCDWLSFRYDKRFSTHTRHDMFLDKFIT
jgi:hypothetical protein